MPKQIQAPDGGIVEFPDDMRDADIARVMRKTYGGPGIGDQAKPKPQQPAPQPQRRRNILEEVAGAAANFNRMVPLADEAGAGMSILADTAMGKVRSFGDVGKSWNRARADQATYEQDFAGRRPLAAAAVKGTATGATAFLPGGPTANLLASGSRTLNAARGAVAAGASGILSAATDRGSGADRLKAASEAATNPLILASGAIGGALAPVARRASTAVAPVKPVRPQQVLRDAGVSLTPGQSIGGLAKSTEDLAQRAPILGPAIRGARKRGAESLVRAVANRSLEPLGEIVPTTVRTTSDTVKYVADRLGKVYDDAADLVPEVAPDDLFNTALDTAAGAADELGPDVSSQFQRIVQNRVLSRLQSGPVTGAVLRDIQSQVGERAAKFSSSNDGAQQALGDALEDVSDELKALLGRANPEAGAMIQTANQGWSNYVRLRKASASAGGNTFTPGQLKTAVITQDKSVGKGNVAKGEAVLQDLSKAASEVMPDTFGNPGTADAAGLGALGMLAVTNPAQGATAAATLAAAATPYMLMGRKIVSELPSNASRRELTAAARELDRLSVSDPAVAELRQALSERISRAAGLSASGQPSIRRGPDGTIEIDINRGSSGSKNPLLP